MAALPHQFNPALVSIHAGRPLTFVTHSDRYEFDDSPDVIAAVTATIAGTTPPLVVPTEVAARHFRKALRSHSKFAAYKTFLAGLVDEDSKDYWETAPTIRRNSRHTPAMRSAVGITANKLDEIFITAGAFYDD